MQASVQAAYQQLTFGGQKDSILSDLHSHTHACRLWALKSGPRPVANIYMGMRNAAAPFTGAGMFGTHGTIAEMWSCMYMLTGVNAPMTDREK